MDFITMKNLCFLKDTVKKMKMHARYYKKISNEKRIFDIWFASRIYIFLKKKNSYNSIIKQITHSKKEQII